MSEGVTKVLRDPTHSEYHFESEMVPPVRTEWTPGGTSPVFLQTPVYVEEPTEDLYFLPVLLVSSS